MKLIIFLLLAFSITTVSGQPGKLPDSWQPGMSLTTWEGAGMRQQSDSLRISDKLSFERHTGMDNNKKYSFSFSQKELNDLLAFLKAKNFDKIKNGQPQVVSDGWSSSITLVWNQQMIDIETGAAYTIDEEYRKDLAAIFHYITSMVDKKKRHQL